MHPARLRRALATIGVQPGSAVWYINITALDERKVHAVGCTAVLLGDAAHDGGLALMQGSDCMPGLHDAGALALFLKRPFGRITAAVKCPSRPERRPRHVRRPAGGKSNNNIAFRQNICEAQTKDRACGH